MLVSDMLFHVKFNTVMFKILFTLTRYRNARKKNKKIIYTHTQKYKMLLLSRSRSFFFVYIEQGYLELKGVLQLLICFAYKIAFFIKRNLFNYLCNPYT